MGARSPLRRGAALDRAVAELAGKQHGVVARAQLLAIGASRRAIERRLAAGRLHRVHEGVYLVGHEARAPRAQEMAAVLACGKGAIVSHTSALHLWGLASRTERTHVTVPRPWKSRRVEIWVHSTGTLEPHDLGRVDGVPATRPARALFDFASIASLGALERAVGAAIAGNLVRRGQLLAQLDRRAGDRGAGRLRAVLNIEGGPAFTRSRPEQRFLRLVRRSGLPVPQANFFDGVYELDFLWSRERLVVEIDTFTYHSDPLAFERDRLRDAELEAQGFAVIRVTDRQLHTDPAGVLTRLRRALATRAPA